MKSVLIEKYKFKQKEAEALSSFMMPMLEYYPEKRISAQDLLKHPWLNNSADFDYLMSDREYEKMMMKKNKKKEKLNDEDEINCDMVESDVDLNMADDEDNSEQKIESSVSEDSIIDNPDHIHTQNFNNSFSAYGQHVNLAALDRPNPQFENVLKNF